MVQSLQCLLYKHEDLNQDFQHMVAPAWEPSAGETETGGSLEVAGPLALPNQ